MTIMINKLIYKGGVTKPFGKFSLSHSGSDTVPEFYSIFTALPGILNPGGGALKQSSSNRYLSIRIITGVSSCASHTWGNYRSRSESSGELWTFLSPFSVFIPWSLSHSEGTVFLDPLARDACGQWLSFMPDGQNIQMWVDFSSFSQILDSLC